jgi:hypothetical protein
MSQQDNELVVLGAGRRTAGLARRVVRAARGVFRRARRAATRVGRAIAGRLGIRRGR